MFTLWLPMVDFTSPLLYLHLLVAALILVLPGLALYMLVSRVIGREAPAGLAQAVLVGMGVSIAFWPLLLLYLTLLGLGFSPLLLWIITVIAGGYVFFEVALQRFNAQHTTLAMSRSSVERRLTGLALIALVLFTLALRLGDVQGLAVPLFGDSLHHTMITTLIMNYGQVPSGYAPYVPVDTFTYHFGFHTLAAIFADLTGSGAPYSVLLVGQVLNAMAVPLAYLLNRELFSSRLAGLGAALITAVVSIMPAYYVNWGRYTQLAGQLLVMVALLFLVRAMGAGHRRSDLAMCAVCVGGLVVVHYRVLIFFGLFAIALAAWQLLLGWRNLQSVLLSWARGIFSVLVGLLLAVPWIVNLVVNYLPGLTHRLSTVTEDYLAEYNNPDTVRFYVGLALPLLAIVGFLAGLGTIFFGRGAAARLEAPGDDGEEARVEPLPPVAGALALATWVGLLFGVLWVVPGAIGSYSIALTMYIPLGALGGYGIGQVCDWLALFIRGPRWAFGLLIALAAPVLAWRMGTWHVADPARYSYVHSADTQAFDWVKSNTPAGSKFLISSQFTYKGRGVTASDAGMWLPLLAGRNVSVPALSAWMERPIATDFFTDTRQLAAYTQPLGDPNHQDSSTQPELVANGVITAPHGLSDPTTLDLMRKLGVTHVYVGTAGGSSLPRLDVSAMRRDTRHYRLLYLQQGVYVFQVVYQ